MRKRETLWTKNFTLIIVATAMGAIGGIAARFALSFLVFDETGSTLAAGLLVALNMLPAFVIPLVFAPRMDRMPRKPFLVGGDAVCGVMYLLAGAYLLHHSFSYGMYMAFSLFLSCLESFDSLAYNSLYPRLIPEKFEQKGYAVSGMLYPTLNVLMTPVAAILYERTGVAVLLLGQGVLSLLAALVESRISVAEVDRREGGKFSFRAWRADMREAIGYLRGEKGIQSIYTYMAVTNGVGSGYGSILVAFFRTMPGFSVAMYSFFTAAEFIGRTLGGLLTYKVEIPPKRRFSFAFMVYQVYEAMDMLLLWIPYPFMLVNRAVCGFLGINSAAMRQAAVQKYIPDKYRAKLNAFEEVMVSAFYGVAALLIGALGEALDYRLCMTACGMFTCVVCWSTIWRRRREVAAVYQTQSEDAT